MLNKERDRNQILDTLHLLKRHVFTKKKKRQTERVRERKRGSNYYLGTLH